MTKGELRYRFGIYAEEAGRCKKSGCYWSLLHLLMSLPDVCSALEMEDRADKGGNVGERYKNWCRKYLATEELDGTDWWNARNAVLHQGLTIPGESSRYPGFIFSPPGGPGHKVVDPSTNRLRLDVWSLSNDLFVAMERLVWTSMLFPGYRPAVFDDIPITAIVTMETKGTGTRYVFTALHRNETDFEKNKASGWRQGTEIALDQFVAHVKSMK